MQKRKRREKKTSKTEFNMSKYLLKSTVDTYPRPATVIAASPICGYMLAGGADRSVRYVDPIETTVSSMKTAHTRGITAIAISDVDESETQQKTGDNLNTNSYPSPIICSSGKDDILNIWLPKEAVVCKKISPKVSSRILCISIFVHSKSSKHFIIMGLDNGEVAVYDLDRNEMIKKFLGHVLQVSCVSWAYTCPNPEEKLFNADHLHIFSGSKDKTIRIWRFKEENRRRKLKHSRSVACMAVAKKSLRTVVVSGCSNGKMYLWDSFDGVLLQVLEGHVAAVTSVCLWETDEILIISGSVDKSIRVYDALTGECVCTLLGHRRGVRDLIIYTDPGTDYTVCISCSVDRTWKIWDLQAILDTFYYPSVEDNEYVEGVTLVGRNKVPAYNPPYTYKDVKGRVKHGYVKECNALVEEVELELAADTNQVPFIGTALVGEEASVQVVMDMNDYEISDSDSDNEKEYISLPALTPKPPPSHQGIASDGARVASDGVRVTNNISNSVSASTNGKPPSSYSADNFAVVTTGGAPIAGTPSSTNREGEAASQEHTAEIPVSRKSSVIQELRKLSLHHNSLEFNECATPTVNSNSPDGRNCLNKKTELNIDEMKRQTGEMRMEHAAALALVHRETTIEKHRAAQKLAVRLTTRGLTPFNISSSVPNSSMSSVDTQSRPFSAKSSPVPPGGFSFSPSNKSPNVGASRGRYVIHSPVSSGADTTGDSNILNPNKDEINVKNKLLMQHHIESARHHSYIQSSRKMSQMRLEQRLSRQAAVKVKELSVEDRYELTKEIENNSDDDIDSSTIVARKQNKNGKVVAEANSDDDVDSESSTEAEEDS